MKKGPAAAAAAADDEDDDMFFSKPSLSAAKPEKEGDGDDEREGLDMQDIEMGKFEVDPDDEKIMHVKGEEEWRGHRSLDGVPITPFNLKEEKLEGDFDAGGTFVWHKRETKDRHLDAWYDEFLEKQGSKLSQFKGKEEVALEAANDSDDEREEKAEQRRRMREKTKARKERELRAAQQLREEKKSKQLFSSLEHEGEDQAPKPAEAKKEEEGEDAPPPASESESEPDDDDDESDPDMRTRGHDDDSDSAGASRGRSKPDRRRGERDGGVEDEDKQQRRRTEIRKRLLQILEPGETVYDAMRRLKKEAGISEKKKRDRPAEGSEEKSSAPPPSSTAPIDAALHTKRQRDGPAEQRPAEDARKRSRLQGTLDDLTECADQLFQLDYFDAYTDKKEKIEALVRMADPDAAPTPPAVSLTSAAPPAPAAEDLWEYKVSADAAESFGPFPTSHMMQWRANGLFNKRGGARIWVRRVPGPNAQQWVDEDFECSDQVQAFLPLLD